MTDIRAHIDLITRLLEAAEDDGHHDWRGGKKPMPGKPPERSISEEEEDADEGEDGAKEKIAIEKADGHYDWRGGKKAMPSKPPTRESRKPRRFVR